jgi:hypothetical protein
MVRHYILAISLMVFLTNCAPNFPIEYYISSSCLPQNTDSPDVAARKRAEAQAIIDGADAWNKESCTEFFRYMGVVDDDLFTFEDLQDGLLVVYCVNDRENAFVNEIIDIYGEFAAYSIADIVIKRKGVEDNTATRYYELYHHPEGSPIPFDYYLKVFKAHATHEFGHQFRPYSHNSDERGYSVMNPSFGSAMSYYTPTQLDLWGSQEVTGICERYGCPPEYQCPAHPTF